MKKILYSIIAALAMILGSSNAMAADYQFSYNKAAEVLKLTWAEGTSIEPTGEGAATLTGYSGYFSFMPTNSNDDFLGTSNELRAYVALAAGSYTLDIPAGAYTINGVPCNAISETFTVEGEDINFDGEKWKETIFTAGETTLSSPIGFSTTGLEITTQNNGNLSVTTNIYEEKEIDWLMGCKFIIVAKDNISAIVFEAAQNSNLEHCIADKGTWDKGTWTGALMKGETLTLTANEAMLIKSITAYYNGEEISQSQEDIKGVISIIWPKENEHIEKIEDGGLLAKFTTSKFYSQVIVELRNVNSKYHSLYDLPIRYMDQIAPGTVECKTSTPGVSDKGDNPAWYTFNGDSYELIIKGYVNYWDNEYDAIAIVPVVGTGIEHEKLSAVSLIKITPETADELHTEKNHAKLTSTRDNIVTVEFDAPVTKVEATTPGSLMAGTSAQSLKTEPVEGTDYKVWTITVPQAYLQDSEGSYEINIAAYDLEGLPLEINPNRVDHALAVWFEVTDAPIDPSVITTLGTPAFSVADGADVSADLKEILMTFPEVKGYSDDIIVKVEAVLAPRNMGTPTNISAWGTIGEGVSLPVSLIEDMGYMLYVNTINLYKKISQVDEDFTHETTESLKPEGTYNTNYSLYFYTKGSGDDDEEPIKIEITNIVNYAAFAKVTGFEKVLGEINADSYMHIGNVEVNGEFSFWAPDDAYGEMVADEFRLTADNDIKEGVNTIVIPAESIEIGELPLGAWFPNIKYTNLDPVIITFTVENGQIVSGIGEITLNAVNANRIYNIAGQQISNAKGIIIVNGKKHYVK